MTSNETLETYASLHRRALTDWIKLHELAISSDELVKAKPTLLDLGEIMEKAVRSAAETKAANLAGLRIKGRMILIDASSAAGSRASLPALVVSLCQDLETLPS